MKGIVFNLLEQVVTDEFGEDTWEALLDSAGVDGAYTAVGTYEHDELHKLVAAASEALSKPADEIVRWFGAQALPLLADRYGDFFTPHDSAKSFVLTLNDVIHPEVRKLFPGAYAPDFTFDQHDDGSLSIGYESYRGLCSFAEGLVEGTATHYRQTVEISQPMCTKNGDTKCVLLCRFS